jgi:hypothetical protein
VSGYGKCQKRSLTLGGRFLCVVDKNANCSDTMYYNKTGHYLSTEACADLNKGKPIILSKFYSMYFIFSNMFDNINENHIWLTR